MPPELAQWIRRIPLPLREGLTAPGGTRGAENASKGSVTSPSPCFFDRNDLSRCLTVLPGADRCGHVRACLYSQIFFGTVGAVPGRQCGASGLDIKSEGECDERIQRTGIGGCGGAIAGVCWQ